MVAIDEFTYKLSVPHAIDWSTNVNIESAIQNLELATVSLRTQTRTLNSSLSIITSRQDFSREIVNTLTEGAAKLTDADMNIEAASMLMLQTRQLLSTTALSLASGAAQSVLALFLSDIYTGQF